MTVVDKELVMRAFDRAGDYASQAQIQHSIAVSLARRAAGLKLPGEPAILELGCGTGFLTKALLCEGVDGSWVVTDKSPAMVDRCSREVGENPSRRFAVLDGEYDVDDVEGSFDLICASMAMQWFDNLPAACERLIAKLKPGGHLLFNTLLSGTFKEWRHLHARVGVQAGAIEFPLAEEIRRQLLRLGDWTFSVERHVENHSDAHQFLRRLKSIGAATSRVGHRPLRPAVLRQIMREFDILGANAHYELLVCLYTRTEPKDGDKLS